MNSLENIKTYQLLLNRGYFEFIRLRASLNHLPLASLTWVLQQEPGRIEYYICLCGHLGDVSELQTSLDVSDLFKGHEEMTSCSALVHSYLFPLLKLWLELLYRKVGNL